MADLSTLVQTMGPGLGHMLGLQQQDNAQAQVLAQTKSTLESALNARQRREFEAQNQPYNLESLIQRNEAARLGNDSARRENQINAGVPVEEEIRRRKNAFSTKQQDELLKAMPNLIGQAHALPDEEKIPFIQNELRRRGADPRYVDALGRIPPKDIVPMMAEGFGRIASTATPRLNSNELIAYDRNQAAREKAYADNNTRLQIQEMRYDIERRKIEAKAALDAAKVRNAKNPVVKTLEHRLNVDTQAVRNAEASGNAEAIRIAMINLTNTLNQIQYWKDMTGPNSSTIGTHPVTGKQTIVERPRGSNADKPVHIPSTYVPAPGGNGGSGTIGKSAANLAKEKEAVEENERRNKLINKWYQ